MFAAVVALSQVNPSDPNYQHMKESGQIAQPAQAQPTGKIVSLVPFEDGTRAGGFFVPLDGSFVSAMNRNDDLSSGLITLPFTFCLYGVNYNSLYINNNGNITFTAPFGGFTSTGFPVVGPPMIAPFWADVDTRPTASGIVWYKITANRLVVIWQEVGYFSQQTDKLNTFQLIMTDGNDPIIGVGNNVGFAYEDMQWTTGSASGGTGGFGGTPATVGVNKGDGVDFALVGRFDHPGVDYDGPVGNNDGISYLDNRRYVFNACQNEINFIPVSNWALFLGLGLILTFAVLRFRRLV
jgi:hypothetical protein